MGANEGTISAFDQLMNEYSQREALVNIDKIFYAFRLISKPLDEVLNVQQVFSSLFKQNFVFVDIEQRGTT